MTKKYLLVADFPSRLKFYLQAIKKTRAKNQSICILVPDLTLIPYFTKYIKYQVAILHAGLPRTERWLVWNKIRFGQAKIIIGSQSALFAPIKNLGLIIVDQEENNTYKNDRSPRFRATNVATQLAELSGANLILGSLAPSIETYHQALNGKYRILKKDVLLEKNIALVDMNSEKYAISNPLETAIEQSLQNNQKILLVLNRKGEGTKFSCADCGWIALCEKCGLPLIPEKAKNVCFRCQKTFSPLANCPKCHGIHLKPFGLGTTRLKKFLTDLFPKSNIIQIEKTVDDATLASDWQIAIVTSYGLKFTWPKIGLVGIIDADQSLNFPDFSSPQKTFQNFYKFLRIGERGIIQTHLPENYCLRALARMDYEKFFIDELLQRKKFAFPPSTRLIRLLFKSVNMEEIGKETARVYKMLVADRVTQVTVLPPHACFIEKERGKYRWQIIIKIRNTKDKIQNELKDILRALPKGWIVDVDPVNLL